MQIKLYFDSDRQLCVPFNYQYQLESALYHKLAEVGTSDFWHDEGFQNGSKCFKAFCFGSLTGKYTVIDNKLCFKNGVTIEVRSPVFDFCDDLQRAFELSPEIKLFDTRLTLRRAELVNCHINAGHAVFRALTPITVYKRLEDGKTHYFTPDDDEFYIGICNNFSDKYEAVYRSPAPEMLIRPCSRFKKIVTSYKGTIINGYLGELEVKAPSDALEFLYNTGMGSKSSQGFGFLKLL